MYNTCTSYVNLKRAIIASVLQKRNERSAMNEKTQLLKENNKNENMAWSKECGVMTEASCCRATKRDEPLLSVRNLKRIQIAAPHRVAMPRFDLFQILLSRAMEFKTK